MLFKILSYISLLHLNKSLHFWDGHYQVSSMKFLNPYYGIPTFVSCLSTLSIGVSFKPLSILKDNLDLHLQNHQ